jgi:outer membrane protein assembly factor BamB
MRNRLETRLSILLLLMGAASVSAQDWPQWRGPNRDNKIVGFTAPKVWPKELTKKWQVSVGVGESSPVLVGDKIFVFARQGDEEVTLCLDAATGQEVWKNKYGATKVTGGASKHPGTRSTPAVADGKVCTLGVGGVLSCLDAATGNVVWRKDTKAWTKFFASFSPIIVQGNCIAYVGGDAKGEVVAIDLATGEQKWQWANEGPPHGSPALMTVAGTQQLVTLTEKSSLVGLGISDGKLLWKAAYSSQYNSPTPIIDGQTVWCSGPKGSTVAFKIEKQDDSFTAKQVWRQALASHQFSTPVLREGLLFGLSSSRNFFCMDAKTGNVLWTDQTQRGECGNVLDAGSVLLGLTSDSELVVFEPSSKEFVEIAKYKVATTPSWSLPIIAGNRIFVKDRDSVTLWSIGP